MHPGVHAAATPDEPAVVMAGSGETITYRELEARSNQLAHLFRDRGLRPGDGVAFSLENHPRFLEICWAAQRSGLYYTAISSRLTPPEVEYIVDDCGASVFITSAHRRDVAEALLDATPGVHTRLVLDADVEGHERYEEAVGPLPADPIPDEAEGQDMLYSSGTTGRPKGVKVALSGGEFGSGISGGVPMLGQLLYGFGPDTVYLSPAPLYHAAPLRFCMAVHRLGGTVIVMEHFDPVEALDLIERHRVTHSQWVPTMFVRMLKLDPSQREGRDLSSLKVAIHAAAPISVPVKKQMIEWWGPVLYEYYAGTEGNGFVQCNSEEWLAHEGTVGRALVGTVHIVGEDGEELGPNEIGTVYFEGGANFEYHNAPEKTKGSYNDRGWSTLGDVGYLDGDGFLHLTDRKDFMILIGGTNVYPQESENVLVTHPKVADVAVFGIPHAELGEEVKAVVQPVDMADAGPDLERELMGYCKEQLASFKVPKSIDFRPDLPRHPTGKLYKRLLRDEYWRGHETRIV